jgi:hypothetical protein
VILAIHIALKLTFNYWQPYVIPNDKLKIISDFIDSHRWIQATLNGILYVINGTIVILCSIKRWWFKSLKQSFAILIIIILSFLHMILFGQSSLFSLILSVIIPLILDYKKWLYVIITFVFSNVFMFLSLWLEGFVNTNDMQYICKVFLQFDYYIMLVLSYFVINFITFKKKVK